MKAILIETNKAYDKLNHNSVPPLNSLFTLDFNGLQKPLANDSIKIALSYQSIIFANTIAQYDSSTKLWKAILSVNKDLLKGMQEKRFDKRVLAKLEIVINDEEIYLREFDFGALSVYR